jgi:selenocysteine lyase/cysteine desulfurase
MRAADRRSDATGLFSRPAVRTYVDTATYGLPPLATIDALETALRAWADGTADWIGDWDAAGDDCRSLVAPLLGAPPEDIALIPAAAVGVGLVAAGLGPEDEVVVPEDEFSSVLLPLLVAERARGARIRRAPFGDLAEAVGPSTTLVATSHVRSNGGGVQDLESVSQAARAHGARVLVDATHAAGILPVDAERLGLDYVVCAAYKHLLCPRGVAFMRLAQESRNELQPLYACGRALADPYSGSYGRDLADLASDASRFDLSLAWHAWVGARASLELLASIDPEERRGHSVGLATTLAQRLALQPTGSSIVGIPVSRPLDEVRSRLAAASVAASIRAGQVRVSFHIYNGPEEVDHVASVLEPLASGQSAS